MIGIFDSGVGGLSVFAKIRERAPRADVVYFGDTANAPYGTRPLNELRELTSSAIALLLSEGARDIVSACNSVSVFMTLSKTDLSPRAPSSITEMTRPTLRALARDFSGKKIAFFATPATIASGIYARGCAEENIDATFIAIPELAGSIESGVAREDISSIIARAISLLPGNTDVISLSCTHYPFVRDIFTEELARANIHADIFDPADSVAEDVRARCGIEGEGKTRFILSKDSAVFRDIVSRLSIADPIIEIRQATTSVEY